MHNRYEQDRPKAKAEKLRLKSVSLFPNLIFKSEIEKMNLEVINHLIDNEHYIMEKAADCGLDGSISLIVAQILRDNNGELSSIKGKQIYHYENVIRPLLEEVVCEGPIGFVEDEDGNYESSCINGGIVDDESLYQAYLEEDFKCQTCRYDAEKMH